MANVVSPHTELVMPFNLRLIRVFLAIALLEHHPGCRRPRRFAAVGIALGARVGAAVGAILLERTPSGVRLTEAGDALLVHARNIFAEARAAEEDLEALAGLTQGTLRVGGSPTIATYMLPPLLQTFHSRYPGVELLTSGPSRAMAGCSPSARSTSHWSRRRSRIRGSRDRLGRGRTGRGAGAGHPLVPRPGRARGARARAPRDTGAGIGDLRHGDARSAG